MSALDALCMNEPELARLRQSVRDFIRADRNRFAWQPRVDCWLSCWDEDFSARLGAAGFVGLTIPRCYGGQGLTHLHRYVVTEELLAHGAPVAAHWTADRQLGPGLLKYGSEEQRRDLLPRIAAGRLYSAVGMSEHTAGSDLAAAQTKATRCDGGWLLNGTKVWTSGAHLAHQIVVFARTSPHNPQHRHRGFSQFLVPCHAAGVTIRPIALLSGECHFNEVVFEDVLVPNSDVLGTIGEGWQQVTAELAFERSGPERILSTAPLIVAAIQALATEPPVSHHDLGELGDLMARLISLRQLSASVARVLAEDRPATERAALVKDLGTRFEQDSVNLVSDLLDSRAIDPTLRGLLTDAWMHGSLYTLRGGTNEVLRGVVARGIGLR